MFVILPIYPVLDVYARQKAMLKTKGNLIDDFDLLIGATAIFNNIILATRNTKDFERIDGIKLINWID